MKLKIYDLIDKDTGIMYKTEAVDKEKAMSIVTFTIIKNDWKTSNEDLLLDKNREVLEFMMQSIIKRLLIIDFK